VPSRLLAWQIVLLLPQPVLSALYLAAVRAGRVEPSVSPLLVLALLPAASALAGNIGSRRYRTGPRRWYRALVAIAALELLWATITLAMVAFTIAWRG